MKLITLNNGVQMPQLGLGIYQVANDITEEVVTTGLEAGYRSFDTAQFYDNEIGVGQAIKHSDIPRKELFVTTKVWNSHHGFEKTLEAFEDSLTNLQLDYIDLYLIHWPMPMKDKYVETYRALEKLYKDGHVKAIGVSNFHMEHIETILRECDIKPVLNQVECHPYFQQQALKDFCKAHDIYVEAWSPLSRGAVFDNRIVQTIASKYNKTSAQIILRWHIQENTIVIPKSITPSRIKENINVFDFTLTKQEMQSIYEIDKNERAGREPNEMDMI